MMLKNPATKYRPFTPVNLPNRVWPTRTITQAPIWMSTDLRDGNQSLFEPMDAARKMRMFKMLVAIGFKEIEVAFPSASETDFNFVRELIEGGHIPDDVTIEVLTQARDDLIERTFDSLRGAKRAIVHLYNATAPEFRKIVFGLDRDGVKTLAVNAARTIKRFADAAGYAVDWKQVGQLDDQTFVNGVAQIAPFDAASKQALLEAGGIEDRAELLIQLMRFFGRHDGEDRVTLQ